MTDAQKLRWGQGESPPPPPRPITAADVRYRIGCTIYYLAVAIWFVATIVAYDAYTPLWPAAQQLIAVPAVVALAYGLWWLATPGRPMRKIRREAKLAIGIAHVAAGLALAGEAADYGHAEQAWLLLLAPLGLFVLIFGITFAMRPQLRVRERLSCLALGIGFGAILLYTAVREFQRAVS